MDRDRPPITQAVMRFTIFLLFFLIYTISLKDDNAVLIWQWALEINSF